MPGPYQTETEVHAEPMPREIAALHRAGRVRSGDPDRLVHDTVLRHLIAACDDAGVELGAVDRRTLDWLVGWEPATVQLIIDLIRCAHAAGRAGVTTAGPGVTRGGGPQ